MKILLSENVIFQRRLLPKEEAEYSAVLKAGKQKVGNTGHSILIVPSISFPAGINPGVGNMLDKEGKEFVDFAKQYWGINCIQLLPEGKYKYQKGQNCLPYSGSSLDLGTHIINLESLTLDEYAKILSKEDLKILNENPISHSTSSVVLYETILPKNSKTENVLRKAYDELLKSDTSEKKRLLKQIQEFSQKNKDWVEPKAIFEALSSKYQTTNIKEWGELERNLYNVDIVSLNQRKENIQNIRNSQLGKEVGFYEFKQFLADRHLASAKNEINKKGIKLSGDFIVGFSPDEVWANPKAFVKNSSIGWGIPALDYNTKEGEKLFRLKIRNFAKRFDALRIDASWSYILQPIKNEITNVNDRRMYDSKLIEIIEEEVRREKGKDFNLENIMHELVVTSKKFEDSELRAFDKVGKDRVKIYTTFNLSDEWATTKAFEKRGLKNGSYVLGVTNHDSQPLKIQFQNVNVQKQEAEVLARILKIPKEKLQVFNTFVQAKFAETMRSKHNMFFYTEALNLSGSYKDNVNKADDYRIKIPKNYQEMYFKSLEKGEGFNVMDALEKAFIAEGLDKTDSELYKKIVKYRKILQEPEKKTGFLNTKKGLAILISVVLLVLATVKIFSVKK